MNLLEFSLSSAFSSPYTRTCNCKVEQPGGHPGFVLIFAALLLLVNSELGYSATFQASLPSWKGMKYQLAGISAAWWSGRCLVQQGGSRGTACIWVKVALCF